jgi:hypothetical protein
MSTGVPLPPNPAYQNVPPAPANSSNTVLKIVLIVIGVIVLFGVIIAGIIGFGVYKMSKSVQITTGHSAMSAAELGTVPYPGASTGDGSMNMKLPNGSMVTSVFTSSDSSDKIVAFYKEKLGDQASVVQTGNGTMLSAGEKDKNSRDGHGHSRGKYLEDSYHPRHPYHPLERAGMRDRPYPPVPNLFPNLFFVTVRGTLILC